MILLLKNNTLTNYIVKCSKNYYSKNYYSKNFYKI